MDSDLFNTINDTHGHHTGDALIKLVARTLREQCRKVDTLARWGGEEYLALLPETRSDEAVRIANRIREVIAGNSVSVDQQPVRATISVGVSEIHGKESIDRLLQRADEVLYRAKTLGRNRVCSSQEE
jgi:diguanylate cyclase (GGDEF)-like protein